MDRVVKKCYKVQYSATHCFKPGDRSTVLYAVLLGARPSQVDHITV